MKETHEIKLSKGFENVILYYAKQKMELENKAKELYEAEQEVLKDIITSNGLKNVNCKLKSKEDGIYIICTINEEEIEQTE